MSIGLAKAWAVHEPHLSDEGMAAYTVDGFIVVRGLLDSERVALFAERCRQYVEIGKKEVRDLEGWEEVFLQDHVLWQRDPVLRNLSLHSAIGSVAQQLMDVPAPRLLLDQIICKLPGDRPTLPHQDAPFLPFDDFRSVNAWIALCDVDRSNGSLVYYRGSHKLGYLREVDLGIQDDLLADFPAILDFPEVEVVAKAGDVVFHNCLVVHRAHANSSTNDRLAYSNQYMNSGWTFNGWVHPFFAHKNYQIGDELTDADLFPPILKS